MKAVCEAAPAYLPVAELLADRSPGDQRIVLHAFLHLALAGALDFVSEPLRIAPTLVEVLRTWPWARYCAELGSTWFCGLRHQSERLTPEVRQLLLWLDGETRLETVRERWLDWLRTLPSKPVAAGSDGRAALPPEVRFATLLTRLQATGAVL